jgi:anti-sigma factor (TIGR02949 family)
MKVINFEDGQCRRVRSYLDSYLNNELLVETNHEVLAHIETCEACSQSLDDRARVKAQLKRAIMREYVPVELRDRISADLRRSRGFSFNRFSVAFAAAAAVLVFAAATFFIWRTTSKPLSIQAEVAAGDVTGEILKIGFNDHVFCAIDHNLANKQFTPQQISAELGPEYSGLLSLVKERIPGSYSVAVGHRCHYRGREFIHLIMRNPDQLMSLVITRKNGEVFPTDGAAAIMRASGVPIHETSWHNVQVAGLETRNYLAFVISNNSREGNEQIAARLAPAISDFLRRLEA